METVRRGRGVGPVSPINGRIASLTATPHHSLGVGRTSRGKDKVKGVLP